MCGFWRRGKKGRSDADSPARRAEAAGLTLRRTEDRDGNTYIVYRGDDPEAAKRFLRAEPVPHDRWYVVVETPDGVWGTDSTSLYLENLRPWQCGTAEPDVTGAITALIDGTSNLVMAARGVVDNYLVEVTCGRCSHEWIDGVRYQDLTLVRCPVCSAINRIDSSGIGVTGF
jgi:hypothetical protein